MRLTLGMFEKNAERLVNRHVEHVADGLAAVGDLKGLAVITLAPALLAWHVDVGKEVHLDLDLAIALAGLATASRDVEAEAARRVPAGLGLGHACEQVAQVVPEPDVRRGVGPGRAADGRLVDVDDLVDEVEALERPVGAHGAVRAVDGVGQRRRQGVGHQRALARPRDARHDGEGPDLDIHVDVFEVVGRRPEQAHGTAFGMPALKGQVDRCGAP